MYTSVNNKRLSQSPSLKKIDRYRASLRRRKAEQRSKSEPRIGEQTMYKSENDISIDTMDTESSDNKENEDLNTAGGRISRYDSVQNWKRLYEPHKVGAVAARRGGGSGGTSGALNGRSSAITRSCSLSSLHRCNSLDDIPKGIAKSKIQEIQRRVNTETHRHSGGGSDASAHSPSSSHGGSTGALHLQSPTPKTVISPGGRVTSPDQVTSPRNLVTQRVYPVPPKRTSTPMFFGGVPVTGAAHGADQSTLVPPPRRSRNRNVSKTVSSVLTKFDGAATNQSSLSDQSQYMNIGSVTKNSDTTHLQKKRPAPLPKPSTLTENDSTRSSSSNEPARVLPTIPVPSLKRPIEATVQSGDTHSDQSAAVKVFKRPSSVPPQSSQYHPPLPEKPCPPTIIAPPRNKKGLAPKAPIRMGVSSISPSKQHKKKKGPAPLPPGSMVGVSSSTDDTSSSGDSMSVQSAEGIVRHVPQYFKIGLV